VLAVLFWLSCLLALSWMSCSDFPALAEYTCLSNQAVLFWLSFLLSSPLCLAGAVLFCGTYGSPVLLVMSLQTCSACPILAAPFWLSCSSYLTCLSFSGCLLLSVLPWLSCPCSPVLATLSWQPCLGNSVLNHVLEVLSWKSHSACPILSVLF
jgi:hypothetical protein